MSDPTDDAQESLRRREAFFHKVLQHAGDVTSVLAPDGRRLYVSSGVTKMLGYTEEEALSLRVAAATHPDDQARVLDTFRRLLARPGSTDRVRFRQRRKDGSWCTVDAFVHNACEDPDVGGVVVNTRDVTEQIRLEAQFLQAQKLESVGRLAGGVAHDFNNLLTIILSCAELLQRGSMESPAECLSEIIGAADRARALTRQLLAFARKEVMRPTALDLSAQVRSSEKILQRLVGEDVAVETELEPALWPVLCDAGQIDQVLFNLVVNARDATPSGGRITIQTANVPGEDGGVDRVRLVVRDTGTGIPADVMPHLFEPFFTTKPTGKGTGLGLSTVHGIVQQHGGELKVESLPGHGSTFELLLPRCVPRAVADEAPLTSLRPIGTEHVLVVEDDPSVRQLAVRALARAGYHVTSVADGAAAIRLLADRNMPLDLVVTDVVLPAHDGVKVAQFARDLRPGVQVLFTSGYPADRLSTDFLLASDVDFLPKPFTPSVLLQRVREALDRGRAVVPGA